ncbi:MAG: protein disulfide isomerase 1 [Monoraphidium minutum]|nr:MAG: protein disulfide isomerase 1 [Monoraphidium minutum]
MMSQRQWLALLLGVLLVSAPLIRAEEEEYDDDDADDSDDDKGSEEKDVVVITEANFEEKVKNSKFALVEFYAPWCGHCQKLAPEYAKAATALKKHDPSIVIAKVDATKEADLGKKYEVSGYPTIKWFVDGEVAMDYNGPRDGEGIVRWIKKKTGPAAVALADKDALAEAEKEHEVVVVAYFKALEGAEYEAFTKAAQKSEDATFFETTDAAVGKAAGLDKPGVGVVTNFPGEDRVTAAAAKVTDEAITELLKANKLPPTVEFNDKNSGKIFGAGIEKQLLLLAKADDLKKDAKVFKAFREVALALKGKAVFVTVDLDGTGKDPVVNFFGVKDADAPVIVGFDMGGNKKYKFTDKDITAKTVKAFAQGLLDGKLTPEYKSAAIPDEPTDGGVTIVVGKNFDKVVKDEGKDVLLEVYAPWCGHCKSLEPIYKKLAKRFNKIDSVVIAKMDGTENEHPDVEVKGFPTIIFYPSGKDAKPINFDGGDRSLKALTKFIKKNAVKKFDLPKKGKDKEEEDEKDEL